MKEIIQTNKAPKAVGPYSQAVKANGFLFISGQIPLNPETGEIDGSNVKDQTNRVLRNIGAILTEAGLNLNNVVKTTVLLKDMSLFADMNDVYSSFFINNQPARAAFAVKELPLNVLVEIEAVAVL